MNTSKKFHEMSCISVDAETSGVNPFKDRLVTLSAVTLNPLMEKVESHNWLINSGVTLDESNIAIHGITNEKILAEGVEPVATLWEFATIMEKAISDDHFLVVFNAPFDITLLIQEFKRHDVPWNDEWIHKLVDPPVIDKGFDMYRKGSRTLVDMAKHYGFDDDDSQAHTSEWDAYMSGKLAYAIGRKFDNKANMSNFEGLNKWQANQKRNQALSYFNYAKDKKNEVFFVSTGWPYRTLESDIEDHLGIEKVPYDSEVVHGDKELGVNLKNQLARHIAESDAFSHMMQEKAKNGDLTALQELYTRYVLIIN